MFVELHAQSAFSFLEGAELPETLVAEAARLDMHALALVDRDGLYGAPRFHRAATAAGLTPIIGSEVTLDDGSRLPLLVEDRTGYRNLSRLLTRMKLAAPKGQAALALADLERHTDGLVCLTDPGRQVSHIFTSMFLHGSWMHLIGNMWFLWIFGDNIEDSMGRVRYAVFYLLCGVAAALAQVVLNPASGVPMVGASGAISGVMGAYLILFPRVRVFCLIFLGFFITSIALPGPEPSTDPVTTVPWPARFSCCASVTSRWLSGSEMLVDGGVSGMITTASVARASGCPLTARKPPAPNPVSSMW